MLSHKKRTTFSTLSTLYCFIYMQADGTKVSLEMQQYDVVKR